MKNNGLFQQLDSKNKQHYSALNVMESYRRCFLDFKLKPYTDDLVPSNKILDFDTGIIQGAAGKIDYIKLMKSIHHYIIGLEK